VIEINGLGRKSDRTVAVEDGVVFGLLGPNGAGKTTTASMLAC
jgi:ABC-type multidrug transport system ATPase subunit